jgi:hypothetical protein
MKPSDFESYITNNKKSFTTFSRYRKFLMGSATRPDKKKLRFIETHMRNMINEGDGIVTKRRKPGTGERVIEKIPYNDTATNRRKGLVGKTYDRVTYKNPEIIETKKKGYRKRKRVMKPRDGAPRVNTWISCVQQAKKELGASGLVIFRKTVTDPEDPKQIEGNKVYIRAKEIMEEKKSEAAKLKAAEAETSS